MMKAVATIRLDTVDTVPFTFLFMIYFDLPSYRCISLDIKAALYLYKSDVFQNEKTL